MKDYTEIYEKYDKYIEIIDYEDQFGYQHKRMDFNIDLAKSELDNDSFLIAVIYSKLKSEMLKQYGAELIDTAEAIVKILKENLFLKT